jgi:hypothetical protein
VIQQVEHLTSKHEALSSSPINLRKKETKKEIEGLKGHQKKTIIIMERHPLFNVWKTQYC